MKFIDADTLDRNLKDIPRMNYRHTVFWNKSPLSLTVSEFIILRALAEHPDFVRTRAQLIDACYGTTVYIDDRAIDTHIKRLRHKLRTVDPSFSALQTIYGVGYKFRLP